MTPTVVLIEDHTLVRSGIRALLERSNEVKVVGEAGDGRTAIDLCTKLKPDVVISDVEMEGLNGIETTRQIKATLPDTKVIMLSMHGDSQYVLESLRAGALGYVLKDSAFVDVLAAIRSVIAGKRYLSPPLVDLVMDDYVRRAGEPVANTLDRLTSREREILQLVAEGHTSAYIASLLHITMRTVDTHRSNVMQKLDIHSIAGLTKFAINHGLTGLR